MTIAKKQDSSMLSGNLFKSIVRYTIPVMLTGLLQLLFNAADLIIVGRYCGSLSVAAVGATGSITGLIVNLFIGLSVGSGVAVAHALGAGNQQETHQAVHTAIPLALLSGIILTVVGVLYSETFLRWMNTPANVLPLATIYMQIYFGGIIFMLLYNYCAAILRAAGDTNSPLIYLTIAGIINVGLNLFFVISWDMNVAGVALATTISQAVSAILVLIKLMRRKDACRLHLGKMRFYRAELWKTIRIGLPAGLQSSLFAISNVLIQSALNGFGDALVAGNAAAGNIDSFVYVILNAFHQTALNFIGQNVGAKQYRRARKVLELCLVCVFVVGIAITLFMYLTGPTLLTFYIPDDPEAIAWGMVRISCLWLPFTVCGMMDTSTGALRGMGVSLIPMLISVIGVCGIRIVWIYTIFQLPEFHTPQWLYYSYAFSWTITLIAQLIAFWCVYRSKLKHPA